MLSYRELRNSRSQFLSTTGVPHEEFDQYLPHFREAYHKLNPPEEAGDSQRPQQGGRDGEPSTLEQMEDKLLFIWMAHQVQSSPSDLAHQFGLSLSQADDWINRLLPALEMARSNLAATSLQPNCIQFLRLLHMYEVEYLIVGGRAVAFHGYHRPILDLDIFTATHALNARKLVQVLQAFGHDVAPQALECFQLTERVIRIGQPPFTIERYAAAAHDRFIEIGLPPTQLEILTSISAVTFEECYPHRVAAVIDHTPVQIIGLHQLMANKRASIRLKDADDLAHLG